MVSYRRVRLKVSTAGAADWRSLEFVFSIGLRVGNSIEGGLVFFFGLVVGCVWRKCESD